MITHKQQTLFFLLLLLFIISLKTTESHRVKYKLIHRHNLQKWRNGTQPISRLEFLKESIHRDALRIRTISHKIRRKNQEINHYNPACINGSSKPPKESLSGELDLYSAADYHTGVYFVRLKVGSPAKKFVLVVDTGSDLTWIHCKYRCRRNGTPCGMTGKKRGVFEADRSSSFKRVTCSSNMCKVDLTDMFTLKLCPSPMDPCRYHYTYSDGSYSKGIIAHETVTLRLTNGRKTRLDNVVVGCSESSKGTSFRASDGVMGLGFASNSFGVKAASKFGGKFSYCLVDHLSPKNMSSYLVFGSHHESSVKSLRYTKLELIDKFYAPVIKGISIGGKMLDIPIEMWDLTIGGGAIIDSGTTLTGLKEPVYEAVMAELKLPLKKFERIVDSELGFCFNSTGFDESVVPRLVFHFVDGARFEPYVKSYVIDAALEMKCLGFFVTSDLAPSVIGNIMQQNYLWEFDFEKAVLGFGASSCT